MQTVVSITTFCLIKTVLNSACSTVAFHMTPERLRSLRYGLCETFNGAHSKGILSGTGRISCFHRYELRTYTYEVDAKDGKK